MGVGGMWCCRLLYPKRECYLVLQFGKDLGVDFCKSRREDEDFWNAGIPTARWNLEECELSRCLEIADGVWGLWKGQPKMFKDL
jgi:hypothetical protein